MGTSVEELKELGALFEQGEQTPHHEAGHAIVMAWLKLPFVELTIEERGRRRDDRSSDFFA